MPERIDVEVPGQASLSAVLHRAAGGGAGAGLLFLPALGIPASYYDPFAAALAAEGIAALVLDLRGQGLSRPRASRRIDFGYRQMIDEDVPAAVRAFRARVDGEGPLLLGGHSLGGQVAAASAATVDGLGDGLGGGPGRGPDHRLADGLVFIAAQDPYHRGYRGANRLRVLLGSQLIRLLAVAIGHWPGDRLGFGGRQPRQLMTDWSRLIRTGRWRFGGPLGEPRDYGTALGTLRLPVYAVSIAGDADAPPATVDRLCQHLRSATVTRHHHPPEGPSPGHIRWARKAAGPLAAQVARWARDQRGPAGDDR